MVLKMTPDTCGTGGAIDKKVCEHLEFKILRRMDGKEI
jgi:hypothetical protein